MTDHRNLEDMLHKATAANRERARADLDFETALAEGVDDSPETPRANQQAMEATMSTPERQDDPGEHGYGGIPAQQDDDELEQEQQDRPEQQDDGADEEGQPGTGDQA